ncbi:MAG: hypothetical protein PHQ43_05300, partial [Dehalococcoidales bacterium]|nr:hypothetical protein [Dehalococcoidales bacterium]
MKGKFSSILRVTIALVFVLSLSLVTAVPASAAISSITVTAPTAGETWYGEQDITWTSVGDADTVNIYYSTNNFASSTTIVIATANDGSYSWDTTSVPDGTNYRIKVRATSDPDVSGVSGVFTIDNVLGAAVADAEAALDAVEAAQAAYLAAGGEDTDEVYEAVGTAVGELED